MRSEISDYAVHSRIGDIYLCSYLRDIPDRKSVPLLMRKFIPEDYRSQITEEERTEEFFSVGIPKPTIARSSSETFEKGGIRGISLQFLLKNQGKEFTLEHLKDLLNLNVYEALSGLEYAINHNSKFFHFSKNQRPLRCSLKEISPDPEYIERINELDKKLDISKDPEVGRQKSLDSAML